VNRSRSLVWALPSSRRHGVAAGRAALCALWAVGALGGCEPGVQGGRSGAGERGAVAATASSPAAPVSDLRPTGIVLYQNGVGYVERRGKVQGDTLRLRVRPEQVNDILKSLTVIDTAKGQATSISLPVDKGADRKLQDLPRQLRDEGGLVGLLQAFRGASVTVRARGGEVTGRIVGVESQETLDAKGAKAEVWQLTLLGEGGRVTPLPLSDIRSLSLHDRTLDVGLQKALDISLDAGAWKPTELTIRLTPGAHDLLVSYIIEMPVWKPTYRLVVGDEGRALVQGWAVVDNVTGEDWDGVKLSLVAGEPLSFTYDLHTPYFRPRPHLEPRRAARPGAASLSGLLGGTPTPSAAPRNYPKKKARRPHRAREAAPAFGGGAAVDLADEAGTPAGQAPAVDLEGLRDSVRTMVSGTEVGSLFRYDIAAPVTVPDRHSALVSIMTEEVPGEDVYLFRPTSRGAFTDLQPHRAVKFTNDSGFSLEAGPIALYRGGTFVGEGFVDRVHEGETTFIPYAVDDKVRLDALRGEEEEGVRLLSIVDGQIHSEVKRVNTVTYTVHNRRDEAVKVWIRRGKRAGWTLEAPTEGVVEVGGMRFLPLLVPAHADAKLVAREVTPVTRRFGITSDQATEILRIYLGSQDLNAALKGPIEEVLTIKKRLGEIHREATTLETKKRRWEGAQERLRDNLERLKGTKGNGALIKAQVRKLAEADKELSQIVAQQVKLDDERARLEAKMIVLFEAIHLGGEAE